VPFRSEEHEELVKHVLEFFFKNPNTSDTVEGVARWRLLGQTVRQTLEETRQAMEILVKKGFLRVTPVAGSDDLFSLNEDHRDPAQAFLRGQRDKKDGSSDT